MPVCRQPSRIAKEGARLPLRRYLRVAKGTRFRSTHRTGTHLILTLVPGPPGKSAFTLVSSIVLRSHLDVNLK
jgi:hypothetical protein